MTAAVKPALPGTADGSPADLAWGVGCMRTGVLLGDAEQAPTAEQLRGLAAALPAVFDVGGPTWLERIASHLDAESEGKLGEVLLLSDRHVHVVEPLKNHPGVALLAVSPAGTSVGLVLSQVRAQIARLEKNE